MNLILLLNVHRYFVIRFRIKQINIVGSSPVSWPSRVIQTLQAPPDVAPASITVRTASETSVWVRWVVSENIVLIGEEKNINRYENYAIYK